MGRDLGGRIGGGRGGDGGCPWHRREEPTALVQRDRMRANDADLLPSYPSDAYEAVPDEQHGLAGDRERRSVEEIVRLRHRARERALDREHTERDRSVDGRLHDGVEARQGDECGSVREEAVTCCGAVRAVSAGIADARCRVEIHCCCTLVHE
jgi:hypothetical protein